jgi:hypothetical protein
MGLDIRIPIGLMFSILGAVLVIYGSVSNPQIYRDHSLGVNINLIWGAVIFVFGLIMLLLAWLGRKARPDIPPPEAPPTNAVPPDQHK